jgi:hypothetical protein
MLNAVIARVDAALDEHPVLLLVFLSVVYFGTVVGSAAATPFAPDEVVTVLTSQMPSRSVIWAALDEGVDDAPPMYAVAVRGVHAITGVGHVATRLPSILGVWVSAVVLFVMVRRRANSMLGLAAALACTIASYPLAIEARGYAPAMACIAVALFAWTQLPEGRRRLWHAALLATSLGAASWWHDMAALVFIPILLGEFARWWDRFGADWLALGAVAVAGLLSLPLVGLAGSWIADPVSNPRGFVARLAGAYVDVLAPLSTPLLLAAWLAALVIAIWTIGLVVSNRDVDLGDRRVRGYEIAAAIGFAAVPALAALAGFVFRFEVGARDLAVAIPGLAAAMMVFLATFTPRSGVADVLVLAALLLSFGGTLATSLLSASAGFQDPVRSRPTLLRALRDSSEPVALAAGDRTLQLFYYAERGWPGRAVVLSDPVLSEEILKKKAPDERLDVLRKWSTAAHIEPFFPYTALARSFLVHESGENWVVPKLQQLRATMQRVESDGGGTLWRVRMRAP